MRGVGSQKTPAFPQSKRSLTAGPKSEGCGISFLSLGKHFFMN